MWISAQILIGCIPLLIMALILILRRKMIVIPALLAALAIGVSGFSMFYWDIGQKSGYTAGTDASKEQLLSLVKEQLASGDTQGAEELLSQLYLQYGDDAQITLQKARLAILQGDVTKGVALYEKAQGLDGDITVSADEADYFKQAQGGSILSVMDAASQAAEITYLTNQGVDPTEYGFTQSAAQLTGMSATLESFKNTIMEAAANEEADGTYKEAERTQIQEVFQAVSQVETEKEKIETGYDCDMDTVKQAIETFAKAQEDIPEVFVVKRVDEAAVSALLIADEPEELVEYAEATDSQTAWVAVADQWMRGNLEEDDFSENFITLSTKEYEELVDHCEKLEDKLTDLTAQEQTDVEEMVEAISARTQSLVLAELESRVTPDSEALSAQSKLYLMDSAMQYALGSEESGNTSLQEAIRTAPYSDDGTYKTPLEKVAAIIHDTADSNEIKNTADYLETAYENALPYYSEVQSQDTEAETETATGIPEAYKNQAGNYISTAKAMLNIGTIDASAFPKVTFRLQTAKAIDINDPMLTITDCNLEITDYSVKEVAFDGARVALVCDTSGSMGGSVQSLQEAVSKYVDSMEDKEQTSIIAFADSVKFNSGFQSSAAGLESYISQLDANGGTNIGSGVWQAVEALEKEQNVYKAIIVLTDGEDSSFSENSLNELQQRCENADITLYTIGLGADIQAEYLQEIASYGNGQFIYCNEVDQLEALYAFIHKQMQHNYEITFEARNTDWSERTLAVENEADGAYTQKRYTIAGTDSVPTDGAVITSMDTRKIYKQDAQTEINLIGTGFTTDTAVSVMVSGDMARQSLETEYVDETHIRVIIPAELPVDTYALEATADQSVYTDTLEIFDQMQTLVYGAYTFTAQTIDKETNQVTMSGDVTINDFIHFRGTVTLTGNVDSDVQIRLEDGTGSYIRCEESLPGLLGSMSSNVIYLPSLGSITLYNDTVHLYDLDNYTVDQFNLPSLAFAAIGVGEPSVALYPHKISLKLASVSLNFPLQKEILKYSGELPFTAEANLEALIVPAGLRMKGKVEAKKSQEFKFTVMSFYLSELGIEFDTWKHDYELVLKVGTDDIIPNLTGQDNDSAKYGFDVSFASGNWDSFHIYADITLTSAALPGVSFSDFSIGLEGLSQEDQSQSFASRLWHSSLVGSCEVGFCKLSDYIPQLDAIFGDLALLTLSDTKASISLGELGLSLETTAKLLGAVEVGNAKISVGKYQYSNYLLGIDSEEGYGLYTSLSVGPKLDLAKFQLETKGTTEINLSSKYLGVWVKGTSDINIDFFGNHSSQIDGNVLLAFHNDFKQFTIIAKGTNLKKNKTDGFKITVASNLWDSEITLY